MMKSVILGIIFMLTPLATALAQDFVGKWKLSDGSAIVEVYKSGDVLKVRGSLDKRGFFGRTMDWHRVK